MAYGTPTGPDAIEAYYTHVRRGQHPPPDLLADLQRRYSAIGGTSPLLEHTRVQAQGIQQALEQLAPGHFQVTLGMKHAPPFIEDGIAELVQQGIHRLVGLVLAPHYSTMSIGEYASRARACCPKDYTFTIIKHWHLVSGYLDFLTNSLYAAFNELHARQGTAHADIEVLFTAHSLPTRILDMGDPYPQQLRETAEAVAARANLERWSVAWQSAGRTSEPWIGPDLLSVLYEKAQQGVAGIVVCPAGFVSEHLEILYDLDIEARQLANQLNLAFTRTALPHNDPGVFDALANVVYQLLEAGE